MSLGSPAFHVLEGYHLSRLDNFCPGTTYEATTAMCLRGPAPNCCKIYRRTAQKHDRTSASAASNKSVASEQGQDSKSPRLVAFLRRQAPRELIGRTQFAIRGRRDPNYPSKLQHQGFVQYTANMGAAQPSIQWRKKQSSNLHSWSHVRSRAPEGHATRSMHLVAG